MLFGDGCRRPISWSSFRNTDATVSRPWNTSTMLLGLVTLTIICFFLFNIMWCFAIMVKIRYGWSVLYRSSCFPLLSISYLHRYIRVRLILLCLLPPMRSICRTEWTGSAIRYLFEYFTLTLRKLSVFVLTLISVRYSPTMFQINVVNTSSQITNQYKQNDCNVQGE